MNGIVIPVKRLDVSKERLAAVLDSHDRRRLGLAMLGDVVDATHDFESRWIVTEDRDAAEAVRSQGLTVISDPGDGLNAAVAAGAAAAMSSGVSTLAVLPCDIPLIEADDLERFFALESDVAVASSSNDGTNGLLLRPPTAIRPAFGPESAVRHVAAALGAGLRATVLQLESMVLDIDEPSDLEKLASAPSERESVKLARELLGY